MKRKHATAHMKAAQIYAELSSCKRRQVGCVIVKDDRIISIGYNGTSSGWDNVCEDENNITKDTVLHAEMNAVAKLASSNESGKDATVFITLSPCMHCAKLLAQTGVKEVYYNEEYKDRAGINFLEECDIKIELLKI